MFLWRLWVKFNFWRLFLDLVKILRFRWNWSANGRIFRLNVHTSLRRSHLRQYLLIILSFPVAQSFVDRILFLMYWFQRRITEEIADWQVVFLWQRGYLIVVLLWNRCELVVVSRERCEHPHSVVSLINRFHACLASVFGLSTRLLLHHFGIHEWVSLFSEIFFLLLFFPSSFPKRIQSVKSVLTFNLSIDWEVIYTQLLNLIHFYLLWDKLGAFIFNQGIILFSSKTNLVVWSESVP